MSMAPATRNNHFRYEVACLVICFCIPATIIAAENPYGLRYPYSIGDLSFPTDEAFHDRLAIWGSVESWSLDGQLWDDHNNLYSMHLNFTSLLFPSLDLTTPDIPELYSFGVMDQTNHALITDYSPPSVASFTAWQNMLWLEWNDDFIHTETTPFTYALSAGNGDDSVRAELELTATLYPFPMGYSGNAYLTNDIDMQAYVLRELIATGSLRLDGQDLFVSGKFTMEHYWYPVDLDLITDWNANFYYHNRYMATLADGSVIVLWEVFPPNGTSYIPAVNIRHPDGTLEYYREEMCPEDQKPVIQALASWHSPWSDKIYSHGWEISLPLDGIELYIYPEQTDQEYVAAMGTTDISFWEGPITIHAVVNGSDMAGEGRTLLYAKLAEAVTPNPPTGITAESSDRTISLEWAQSLDSTVTGYKVYWGLTPRTYSSLADTHSLYRFTIRNLTNGTPYYFTVTAYDGLGNESAYAEDVMAIPSDGYPVMEITTNDNQYGAGDPVRVEAAIHNAGPGHEVDFYAAIEVAGSFYFYPDWQPEAHPASVYLGQAATQWIELLSLRVPYTFIGDTELTIYAGLTYKDSLDLIGYPASSVIRLFAGE